MFEMNVFHLSLLKALLKAMQILKQFKVLSNGKAEWGFEMKTKPFLFLSRLSLKRVSNMFSEVILKKVLINR